MVMTASLNGSAQLLQSRYVGDGVRHEINGRHNHRNHAPWSQEQIFYGEVPVILADTCLAHLSLDHPGLPQNQHSDIATKFHRAGLPHTSADLAATGHVDGVHGTYWNGSTHTRLLEHMFCPTSKVNERYRRSTCWKYFYKRRPRLAQDNRSSVSFRDVTIAWIYIHTINLGILGDAPGNWHQLFSHLEMP